MNPILLRNDGPIENDIKPYCLDGKDIKTALEDIKNSLLFLSDKIEGDEEVKVIELLTNLIYSLNLRKLLLWVILFSEYTITIFVICFFK